jgi:hypothetical protein
MHADTLTENNFEFQNLLLMKLTFKSDNKIKEEW